MDTFFYQDKRHATGYYSGGTTKRDKINNGAPPIKLLRTGSNRFSLLDLFLRNAYRLLKMHYEAINWELLKPYEIPLPQESGVVDSSPANIPEPLEGQDLDTDALDNPFADRPEVPETTAPQLSASQEALRSQKPFALSAKVSS